jgi:hypothetical protein
MTLVQSLTDTQILTLVLTLLGIFAASWFNNSRIGDIHRRIDDMRDVLRAEMRLEFERTNGKIDALLKLVADIDQRVTKLEARTF